MLLSPISLDSNVLPGQVPALPSSCAGATGFAEQLQLVAALAPPDAPVSLSIPGATSSLPPNSVYGADAAAPGPIPAPVPGPANADGLQIPAQLKALPVFATIPPAAPIAFRSTAELNFRGSAPQTTSSTAVAETAATPTPAPVTNMSAAEVKPQEEIAPRMQDAPPAIEEAPIAPASAPPQKPSTPKAVAPATEARVERKHHAHAEKAESKPADTPDAQPQPAASVPAPTPVPVHMVLPVAARLNHPLIPLGNRIPAATLAATTRTPVRTEAPGAADPSDPFNSDADPKAAALPAEATKPLVSTADQLAFATKVQLAKPQAIQRHAEPVRSEPAHTEPVRSESHSQPQQHSSSHRDADSQLSAKTGETAAKPAVRSAHATSTFEAAATVSEDANSAAAKPGLTESTRPTSAAAAAAAAEDVNSTRPEMPAAPMKDISVRIQSEQGENVDVRILHRAGDVQIAVKSVNGETTQGLRHGLSELSDRLNATGYHADTWHSGQTTGGAENTADSGNSQHSQQQQSQGDSQSHSGWSQQQRGQRDDNQNNRPRWIEELDANISSSPETGLFHGLIR